MKKLLIASIIFLVIGSVLLIIGDYYASRSVTGLYYNYAVFGICDSHRAVYRHTSSAHPVFPFSILGALSFILGLALMVSYMCIRFLGKDERNKDEEDLDKDSTESEDR